MLGLTALKAAKESSGSATLTYRHPPVQVSPACLRKNRRPVRGEKKADVCSDTRAANPHSNTQQRTTKLCLNCERAARWSDFSPAAPARLWCHGLWCANASTTQKHDVRHQGFTDYIKLLPVCSLHKGNVTKCCGVQLQLQLYVIIWQRTPWNSEWNSPDPFAAVGGEP